MNSMDGTVKDLWVGALRSDEYRQGKGKLAKRTRKGNMKFCCLGVLCDVVGMKGEPNPITNEVEFGVDGETMTLPDLVWKGLGIGDSDIELPLGWSREDADNGVHRSTYSLATLNDDGFTFSQIADLLDHFITPLEYDGTPIVRPGYEMLDRS